jgi:hypothetical protein
VSDLLAMARRPAPAWFFEWHDRGVWGPNRVIVKLSVRQLARRLEANTSYVCAPPPTHDDFFHKIYLRTLTYRLRIEKDEFNGAVPMQDPDYFIYCRAGQNGVTLVCPDTAQPQEFGSIIEAWDHAHSRHWGINQAQLTVFSALGHVLFVTALRNFKLLSPREVTTF